MALFKVGEFIFDASSGQLSHRDKPDGSLAPQPAQLLELLIERYPEAVSREEIHAHLWPDVSVEFQQSLHHCVRQVRQAFDDSAAEPTYVRTLHRKGYQLIAPVTPYVPRRRTRYWTVAALAVALALLAFAHFATRPDAPIRIAVMSFESSGESNSIAEELVARLSNQPDVSLEIIGPTTSVQFEGPPQDLSGLARAFDIDLIVNGRFSQSGPSGRVLAEVIRVSDGAHVWAEYFSTSDSMVALTVSDGLLSYVADNQRP